MKFLFKILALFLYALSFLSNRSKRIWVFGSETGYNGNSKYLLQYIKENHKEIDAFWITKRKQECIQLREKDINAYYSYSLKGIYYCLRAGFYLVSDSLADINFYTSGNCKYIQLWHGVGLKCCLWNNKNSSMNTTNYLLGFIKRPSFYIEPDFVLGTSPLLNEILFSKMFRTSVKRCHSLLYPRNYPILCSRDDLMKYIYRWEDSSTQTFIKKLHSYNSVMLYMPTYRDNNPGFFSNQKWNLSELNEKLLLNNSLLIIKLHPGMKDCIDLMGFSNICEIPKNLDVYPILPFTNTLITDYSSIYYDYILMDGKKIVLYVPDKEDYIRNSRELIMSYEENCIGIFAYNFKQLMDVIFTEEKADYSLLREKFWGHSQLTSFDDLFNKISCLYY